MPVRYVAHPTSRLYDAPTGGAYTYVLIFGDELEVTDAPDGGRLPVVYRGRPGYMNSKHLGDHPALELYFIDVGQGDATFIVTPARKKILIDGGLNRRALGFLAWKYRLDHPDTLIDLDLLVLSHADSDHLQGLLPVVTHPKIRVHQVIHNGIAVFRSGAYATSLGDLDSSRNYLLHQHSGVRDLNGQPLARPFASWCDAISSRNCGYRAVDCTTGAIGIGDPEVTVEVLGPRVDRLGDKTVFRWFESSPRTINGHSVVLRVTYGALSVLLPGDLNRDGAEYLLADPMQKRRFAAHILKAPHHGSHEFYRPLLETIRPQISVISSGDDIDHGHPRAVFVGSVGHCSRSDQPLVFSTEIAANFVDIGEQPESEVAAAEFDDGRATDSDATVRHLFKRRLHGMINVRTDGQHVYAARRVAASYQWESYGPLQPSP